MRLKLAVEFTKEFFSIIEIAGEVADEEGIRAYIVGGPVRDIFLHKPNHDLDFVVEGDAIGFAGLLNLRLKGKINVYRAFGTATINFGNTRIDIVTARKEIYEKPAAYPKTRPGVIRDDLFRRDFTINAMAVAINRDNFGELMDFYGGFQDLEKGVIRVLHDRSFIDDPTRIFRAVRFSTRLGFKIEPGTRKLIKEALHLGFLGKVNKGRIKKEIELFLQEKDPMKCLSEFSRLL